MRLLALDLSLTATGVFAGDPADHAAPYELAEIATPDRRRDEDDPAWYGRRYEVFRSALLGALERHRPELLVVEVSRRAHHSMTRVRDGVPVRVVTGKDQEFRAGAGLGRSEGWLDAVLRTARERGTAPARVELIEASVAKLHVTGNSGASKRAVRQALTALFGWPAETWRESQVDALTAGLGHLRLAEQLVRERAMVTQPLDPPRRSVPRRPRIVG